MLIAPLLFFGPWALVFVWRGLGPFEAPVWLVGLHVVSSLQTLASGLLCPRLFASVCRRVCGPSGPSCSVRALDACVGGNADQQSLTGTLMAF